MQRIYIDTNAAANRRQLRYMSLEQPICVFCGAVNIDITEFGCIINIEGKRKTGIIVSVFFVPKNPSRQDVKDDIMNL